ncbi:Hypothetical Protein FCC1311_032652 [Hondaea fermentalgiana]|uniref:Uncharacterized protein n=1 Tax=Hondaea fermentalgiana TaxID=2315210 RepID=A0A2R5G7L2_9STRA|nr:Hypothetical Protein FCC1311_032652 [Hondaea fermentalgiana]|eukprot:GBG27042.1 Hypothetical Protein FCC1311_032652 [Hondaea fermentalgiana]
MADGREQVLSEWEEEGQRRLEESALEVAGDEERAQLLDVKQHEDSDKWLEHVDAYARQCLLEMAAPLTGPGSPGVDLEKGAGAGDVADADADSDSSADPTRMATASPNSSQSERLKVQQGNKGVSSAARFCVFRLTLSQKLMVRNAIIASIALLLPFFESVQTISYSTSLLIPILALILMLRPAHLTAWGHELHQLIIVIGIWPFYIVWSLVILAASPHNLIGYLILLALGVLVAFLIGMMYPSILMTTIGPTIMFSIIHMSLWQIYNFYDYEDPFKQALIALGGATFGMYAAFVLHWLGSVLIFPWSAITEARQALRNRYAAYATMLRRLRPVYDRIAVHTLDPSADIGRTFVSKELIDALADAREMEVSSIVVSQRSVGSALLETRFLGKGDGLKYLRRYQDTLNLTRNARFPAGEIVSRQDDFLGPAESESGLGKFMEQKDGFLQQDLAQEAALAQDAEAQSKLDAARERIPMLITKLNLLLELGAHRMAQLAGSRSSDRSEDAMRSKMLHFLAREQAVMEKLGEELEELAVSWMELYLRAHAADAFKDSIHMTFLKRTRLISYVLVLLKLVREQKQVVAGFEKEKVADPCAAKREWTMSFPVNDAIMPTLHSSSQEEMYTPIESRRARWEQKLLRLFGSTSWKMAIKFAFGTTLLVLPAMIDPFYQTFSMIQLLNGVFTFQVVIFWSQTGLVLERVGYRMVGITIGGIALSIAWELACINGCTDDNRKWILYAAEVACLFVYIWFKARWPTKGYLGFSAMRTLASMSTAFVTTSDPATVDIWLRTGYVLASSLIGALGALFLTVAIWPTSGRYNLREAIARSYHDFVLITESVLTDRFETPDVMDTMSPQVSAFEHKLARRLYLETGVMIRSAQLETMQRINFDASFELYVQAVKSSQDIWQSLWKLNHLGGLHVYKKGENGEPMRTMHPHTARIFLAANRWLTTSFAAVASQLNSKHRDSTPVLRPLAASPQLLVEIMHDFVGRAYRDEVLLEYVVSSRDLALMLNLPLLMDSLYDISISLDKLYTFMETYLRKPVYADRLRDAERISLDLYKLV